MSRVSSTPQTRASRAGNGICRSTGYSAHEKAVEAGKYYVAVVSWAHQAKNRAVARNVQRLQGPGTAGMIVWRSQARLTIGRRRRRRRAAGLNARSPCVDGMRWRVNGLSCAWRKSDSRTLGQRRDYLRATRRLPAWVTAGKGPIAPGRSRGQNQQVQVPDDRADRPRRQDVTLGKKMPESHAVDPGITAASLPAARILTSQSRKNTLPPCCTTPEELM